MLPSVLCPIAVAWAIGGPAEADRAPSEDARVTAPKPPRLDGPYLGATFMGGPSLIRVNDLDTPGAFSTFGGSLRVGEMVLPWLGLGLQLGGAFGVRSESGARQRVGEGQLLVDFEFVPIPKRRRSSEQLPLSLRASFGFGGGAVREEGTSGRSGFGGAAFGAAVRYMFFPGVKRYRPDRGGGFGLGPELGWIGQTPVAAGRPMANIFYVGLATFFFFGS